MITSSEHASPSRFRLVAVIDDRPHSFPLLRGRHVIGTSPSCRPRLEIAGVSRRHASIDVTESTVLITDLGSKNGTLVNDRPIEQASLELGDEIELCGTIFTLERLDVADSMLALSLTGPSMAITEWGRETTQARGRAGGDGYALGLARRIWHRLFARGTPDIPGAVGEWAVGAGSRAAGGAAVAMESSGPDRAAVVLATHGHVHADTLEALESWLSLSWSADPSATVPAATSDAPGIRHIASGECPGDPLAHWALRSESSSARRWLLALEAGPDDEANNALAGLFLEWLRHLRDPGDGEKAPEPPAEELIFPPGFVRGISPAINSVYSQLRHLTQGDVPVLITGETGVGKELMARTLHLSSARSKGPMVAINCAAIPAELLEAELFGISQGVATGVKARPGRIVEADGGTLFLDEIGDMPANLQVKLLRVLQEKEVQPLGGRATPIDVRLVSATHADLARSIEEGAFRQDLYYRLAGYTLRLPSLVERAEDLPILVEHFLRQISAEIGKSLQGMTVAALRALADYPWPGNIRQLEHEVRRMVYLAYPGQAVDTSLLSPEIVARGEATPRAAEPAITSHQVLPTLNLLRLEKMAIEAALEESDGTLIDAATRLGLTRDSLRRRLVRHGLRQS